MTTLRDFMTFLGAVGIGCVFVGVAFFCVDIRNAIRNRRVKRNLGRLR